MCLKTMSWVITVIDGKVDRDYDEETEQEIAAEITCLVEGDKIRKGKWNSYVEKARIDVGKLAVFFLVLDIQGVDHDDEERDNGQSDHPDWDVIAGPGKHQGKKGDARQNGEHL